MPVHKGTTNGFKRSGTLLSQRIRKATETRGFAESRVLTHWVEIVGDDLASIARPVEVGYNRHGLGATLTVLTTGAHAPVLEMEKEKLRERVNAAYGYNAISRIKLTQTAATGFAEGQVDFTRDAKTPEAGLNETTRKEANAITQNVNDEGLRDALETLAQNFLKKRDLET